MGSSLSGIADDMEYYTNICKMLRISERQDMYDHMTELEKVFGVRGKYELIGAVRKSVKEIADEAYEKGVKDPELKSLIKGHYVQFESFRQGVFFYRITSKIPLVPEYTFPVPLDDIGTATMQKEDKALTFMRWIRKAIEDKTLIQVK